MSVGIPLAGPDHFAAQQVPLKIFSPPVDVPEALISKSLVQKARDIIGPSASGDRYFSDAGYESLTAVLDAPRAAHDESIWEMANRFLPRLLDVIGILERIDPQSSVLREMQEVRRRCIRTFPDAFAEPTSL